jgi:hypothetical protein
MKARPFPPALPHGELREVLPGLSFVTGTIALPGPLPVRFSRNMTVVREGGRVVLVNTLRLDEAGLTALEKLGEVTDVMRLAGFHGADDAFCKDRYGAKVWAIAGQRYTTGFDTSGEVYFEPDVEVGEASELPIGDARLRVFASRPPEALLVLPHAGGTVVAGDCLQNWSEKDAYFSWLAGVMMRFMGFIRPHNVGPGWLKQAKPPPDQLRAMLDLEFENVLPAHGSPVLGGARESYRPAIERAAATRN